MRLLIASIGLLTVAGMGPVAAHGCHHNWQLSGSQGWHSHGHKCDVRSGMGVSRRGKVQNRRPV